MIPLHWKDIAKGHTAVCIFGGPSVDSYPSVNDLVQTNFTVTVNRNIESFPDVDMFITGDNLIAREYLEDGEFHIHPFKGGKLTINSAQFSFNPQPVWISGKRSLLREDLIKIVACNTHPCYNFNLGTGQLYLQHGIEYSKKIPNLKLCVEHRDFNTSESWPTLSTSIPETVQTYGTDPMDFISGGNISSIVFQLLFYMGFEKVVTLGYGDEGTSRGYQTPSNFDWSVEELHAMEVHLLKWGDRIGSLTGGEYCRKYFDFNSFLDRDLEKTPVKKQLLKEKLVNGN